MTLTVDNPILNSPYHEPTRYWLYDAAGMPRVENGRPAGYYFRARTRANERQLSMLSDEQFEELGVVNQIRQQVRAWRAAGYPGATPVTRQLLAHWTQAEREHRLFFCQIEAAETVIWLVEVRGDLKLGIAIPYTFAGAGHNFYPDFLVRLANGATLVLEVNGYEDERDRAKYAAAHRWCEAVSNWGQMGRWVFDHCGGPGSVKAVLGRHSPNLSH